MRYQDQEKRPKWVKAEDAVDDPDVLSNELGAFISCIPGKLGHFEYDDMKLAYVRKKKGRNDRD